MAKRMVKAEIWTYREFVLTNAVQAEQGKMACLDTSTGLVTKGGASTTLLPIGWFAEDLLGDGVKKVNVRLFEEVHAAWWANADAPNSVQAADVGSECYVLDDTTVTTDATGHSKAGRVLAVDAQKGVLVQAGMALTGPTGASGSALSSGGVADRTALKAIAAASRFDGQLVMVRSDGSLWRFVAASVAAADGADELVCVPAAGTGRWLRADKSFVAKLPIAFGTADGAAILTVPAGFVLRLTGLPFWEVTTAFAGGVASAIGIASSRTGYDTAGDILGGAAGNVEADLTAGVHPGTIGPKLDTPAEVQAFLLEEDDTLTFERIASVFTAGAGFVCVPVAVMTPAA